jgi:hypothetical protein
MFLGVIFDGDKKIGFVQHDRFLALHLPTGQHVLSASLNLNHPAANSRLTLNLQAGTYYVRLQEETGLVKDTGRLDLVTCAQAQEAKSSNSTDPMRVAPAFKARIAPLASFPSCE